MRCSSGQKQIRKAADGIVFSLLVELVILLAAGSRGYCIISYIISQRSFPDLVVFRRYFNQQVNLESGVPVSVPAWTNMVF